MGNVKDKLKRVGLTAVLMAVVGMSLAACGDAATATVPPAPTNTIAATTGGSTTGDVQEVQLTLSEWAITPANVEVNAGKVNFVVKNEGQFPHDMALTITGGDGVVKTKIFKTAENPQTVEADLKPGTYEMICDITGHAGRGMKGTVVVK